VECRAGIEPGPARLVSILPLTSTNTFVLVTKYVYIKSTPVYVPSSELGLSQSQPLSRQRVCPTPQNQGGGAHSPAGEGLGESQFRQLEKKLSTLPTLWSSYPPHHALYHLLLHLSLHHSRLPFIFSLPPRHSCCSFNGAVQWEQKGVKIGINRSIMMCSLAGQYPLPCPKEPSREERKLFQRL
jgi:hypothetical protein